jgi:hypothetical protein
MALAPSFYLSGPMSGLPDLNRRAFEAATQALRGRGLDVRSPHELPNGEWIDCLRRDIRLLTECDALVLLPGWPASKGATLELNIALQLQMDVFAYRHSDGALVSMGLASVEIL